MSLVRTDSKASRHIIFSFPVSRYAINHSQSENLSLQAFFGAAVHDLNDLATTGICNKHDGQAPCQLALRLSKLVCFFIGKALALPALT